jgi:hypothetical protein
VHDLEVSRSDDQPSPHEVDEFHPGVADKQQRSSIAHLQQVPGNSDLREGANSAIKANEKIGLREEAKAIEEVGAVNAACDRLIRREAIPRGNGVSEYFATH